jgi:hypothetical protein
VSGAALSFRRFSPIRPISRARLWVLDVPAGNFVLSVSVDIQCSPRELIPLLEDLYYADVCIDGQSLPEAFGPLVHRGRPEGEDFDVTPSAIEIEPERHQLVYIGNLYREAVADPDEIQRLIYRADMDCRPEHVAVHYPSELNRRRESIAAVGPFVSVLSGQQEYIENAAFISAALLLSSAAKAREIRGAVYESLAELQGINDAQRQSEAIPEVRTLRSRLSRMAENIGAYQMQLTFGVDANGSIFLLIPSLRVDSFHRCLAGALDLPAHAETADHMVERLQRALAAQVSAVDQFEAQRGALRRARTAVAIGLITTVAVPISLFLSYFSGNFNELAVHHSLFDVRDNIGIYVLLVMLVLLSLLTYAGLAVFGRRSLKQTRRLQRPMGEGSVRQPKGQ